MFDNMMNSFYDLNPLKVQVLGSSYHPVGGWGIRYPIVP